jgi:hypothetical protein
VGTRSWLRQFVAVPIAVAVGFTIGFLRALLTYDVSTSESLLYGGIGAAGLGTLALLFAALGALKNRASGQSSKT